MRRDSTGITPFLPADSVYLKANVIVNASWVTDNMIALGTLRGGVVFIDAESGQTYDIINYYSGLPDNQVYAQKIYVKDQDYQEMDVDPVKRRYTLAVNTKMITHSKSFVAEDAEIIAHIITASKLRTVIWFRA